MSDEDTWEDCAKSTVPSVVVVVVVVTVVTVVKVVTVVAVVVGHVCPSLVFLAQATSAV